MRVHTLEATGGRTCAQMPRFATADGNGTNDPAQAQKNPDGAPQSNSARDIRVTETVGIGFVVLTIFLRRAADATAGAVPRTEVTA